MSAETSAKPAVNLTAAEKKALSLVGDGCDVMDTQLAFTLREVQTRHPELLWIGHAMGRYAAGTHHPYFGAKLTSAGVRAISKATSAETVLVKVRMDGFGYVARAGRGKRACSASSTSDKLTAVRRAAAKYFRIDACNIITPEDLFITIESQTGPVYRAELPEKGGAE